MTIRFILLCWLCFYALVIRADTHYVAQSGQTPSGTYLDWSTAASNIQDAVNVAEAAAFDTVLVSNGTYNLTNQITITNGITVQGFNGKLNTFINGNYPAYSNRCFLLSNTVAVVDGFTITNGCLKSDSWLGGGVRIFSGTVRNCSIISNTLAGNSTGVGCPGVYMDSSSCVLSNCLVALNSSVSSGYVGGVYVAGALVDGCNIVSNTGYYYGGIYMNSGTIINSTSAWNMNNLFGNYGVGIKMDAGLVSNCLIRFNGGGGANYYVRMDGGTLKDSVVSDKNRNESCGLLLIAGNVVNCTFTILGKGIDVRGGTVSNCTITGSTAYGGGYMNAGIVRNCLVSSNKCIASVICSGVQVEGGSLENSTIVKNDSADNHAGCAVYVGASGGTIRNCIIYSNTYYGGQSVGNTNNWVVVNPLTASFTNCCTTPTNNLPGSGNITNYPAFVNFVSGDYHLQPNSPCVNSGANQSWMTNAIDLDGRARIHYGTVDMGVYETIYDGTVYIIH